jgi:type I restriction enzyme R subunit
MEHAIRHHLREHWDEDPEHYDRLSEKLEKILEALVEQWEQLPLALGDLLPRVRAGRLADDIVTHVKAEIVLVGFWQNAYDQGTLRVWIATRLAEPTIDGSDLFDFARAIPVADRLVELAKANHARLAAS